MIPPQDIRERLRPASQAEAQEWEAEATVAVRQSQWLDAMNHLRRYVIRSANEGFTPSPSHWAKWFWEDEQVERRKVLAEMELLRREREQKEKQEKDVPASLRSWNDNWCQ